MGICARIDDDPAGPVSRFVNRVNERAFMVGLHGPHADTALLGMVLDFLLNIRQRESPVYSRFAHAKHVQVWPVQQQNFHARSISNVLAAYSRSDSNTLITFSSGTSSHRTGSPAARSRMNLTRPAARFLSVPIAAR